MLDTQKKISVPHLNSSESKMKNSSIPTTKRQKAASELAMPQDSGFFWEKNKTKKYFLL